ncbi:MAG: Brp/Blh family beta-carotene 15,15'-dioxygenase [Bacteroidota bacterium]
MRILVLIVSALISLLISNTYQDLLGFLLILTIGLIHGANDLLIIKNNSNSSKINYKKFNFFKTFFTYLSVVFAGLLFFNFYPSIALLSFILVSIYHFGEQHFEVNFKLQVKNNISKIFLIILHGFIVFNIIFRNNILSVTDVFLAFKLPFLDLNSISIILIISIIIYFTVIIISSGLNKLFLVEFIFIGLFYLLSSISTLIFSFSIYFVFFHSLLSIKDQVKFIYGSSSSSNMKRYVLKSLPYFIISIISLIIFYISFDIESQNLLPIIFTFLAAITFPHVLVIEKMYRNMK